LNARVLDLLFAVTLLLATASLLAMAGGEPETMALVAVTGIIVVGLGTAALRLSENLRRSRTDWA
jgi:hypothetical protein